MRKLTLVFLFFSQLTFASFDMNKNMQKSYSYIINLEFEKANVLLAKEQSQNPKNGFILLHKNYIDFLTIFISEDFNYFESHEHFKDVRIGLLDDNDKESPYYLYSKAEVNLQWAFARLKFEQYPTAAYELVKAYKLLEKNQEIFPDFTLNNKGLGLIHTLLGVVPKEFHWILNFAGLKGSVALGLSELDAVLNDNSFVMYEDEVLFLLSFLQINLGNNDALCQKYLDRIGDGYEDNLLLNFSAARLAHNLGKNDYCLRVLNNKPNNSGIIKFYYLDYLQGLSYLYMLDYKNAEQKFEYFLANFRGVNYIKSANHKLAWIAFLQNNRKKQFTYLQRVISNGSTSIDEDKVALKDAQRNHIAQPVLLKARLLYDGGYYSLALLELNQIEGSGVQGYQGEQYFSSETNEIEYWYRLARVESKLNNSEKVIIAHYKKALEKGENSSSYYAPMSALQIGLLYEKKNDSKQGTFYFNKCLSMSGFDYERGIHQKAKAGLDRISN
ncbi:MAG: hypothetical protein VX762_02610 [Bacteroidota bacterium]|nr:hypothetical protein [Bacteroidota bacterium]